MLPYFPINIYTYICHLDELFLGKPFPLQQYLLNPLNIPSTEEEKSSENGKNFIKFY